jgi:putative nucleotidyltransferase with HDIG domain
MSQTVVIDDLQVGMFVHLDLGWWAHPFALSSFLITSPDQITTIRGLGLKQLRWSPARSRPPAALQPPGDVGDADAIVVGAGVTHTDGGAPLPATGTTPAAAAADAAAPAGPALVALPPAAPGPQAAHRQALAEQHAARERCEQQYGEAGRAWHEAQRLVPRAPEQARDVTEALTRALLDKLMVDREMCVRVISDTGGDRVSGHALNVAVIALLMGRVFGFGEDDMLDLGVGSLLHDMGKLDLPDRVRHADPLLNPREQQAYREHVGLGVALAQRMGLREGALAVVAQHHEMADGSGFPARLSLDRMAIGARIVSLINRYDNLCNPAQVAAALTPHEALSLIFAQTRTKFDATMLNAFIRMMGVYPPGSLVQLTDDRYATVVSCNSSRPLKPRVLVCDTRVPVEEALLLNLDGCTDLGIRRSLKATQLPAAARDYLSPRQRMVYFFEPVPADAADMAEARAA